MYPTKFIGPLVDSQQLERVLEYTEVGEKEARLIMGWVRRASQKTGHYVGPTVFFNPKDDARIYREESFGPISTIRAFRTEEEAMKMANDTEYGLSCKYP